VNWFTNGSKIRLFVMAVTTVRALKLASCSTSRPGPKDSGFRLLDECILRQAPGTFELQLD
jgi:hypothetical protein